MIGAIIEQWPIGADGSYHVQGFRYGFSLMIALQIAALVWYFLAGRIIKTNSRKKTKHHNVKPTENTMQIWLIYGFRALRPGR